MERWKLCVLTLALLGCAGCDVSDGMVLKKPGQAVVTQEPKSSSLVEGVEDVLEGVERTARDFGSRVEESME